MRFGNDAKHVKRVAVVGLIIGLVTVVLMSFDIQPDSLKNVSVLCILLLLPATILVVVVGISTLFSINVTDHTIQRVFVGQIILRELPLDEFTKVQPVPPVLYFKGGRRMRLLIGMHLTLLSELERYAKEKQKKLLQAT